MTKVYAVLVGISRGRYSSGTCGEAIAGLYSTKALANAAKKTCLKDGCRNVIINEVAVIEPGDIPVS